MVDGCFLPSIIRILALLYVLSTVLRISSSNLLYIHVYVLRQMKSPKVWSFQFPWINKFWFLRNSRQLLDVLGSGRQIRGWRDKTIFPFQVVLTKMDKLHKEKHQMMIEEVYKIKERFSLNSCYPHIFALRFVWQEDKIHFWCLLQFNWNTIPLQLLIPSSCTQVIAHHTNHNPETSLLLSNRTEREREIWDRNGLKLHGRTETLV